MIYRNKFIDCPFRQQKMSLEIIIQQIKALGYVLPESKSPPSGEQQEQITEKRRFRLTFGDKTFISKQFGYFKSRSQLCFYEPYSFFYDNHARVLNIEIFKEHEFGTCDDFKYQLNAKVDLSDFSVINGDYIETDLTDLLGASLGKLILAVDVFKKGPRFYEKVVSSVFFQAVRQEVERQRQMKVSAAGRNIKNLIVNNQLSNLLMTISSMHVIPDNQDTDVFNKQCFIQIKYGPTIKVFSKLIKSQVKDSISFMDYLQFVKNDEFKFEFSFLFIDELGNYSCRAKGQIKYIIFDETINAHNIMLFDKRSNKYGNLMVKFEEKEVEGTPNIQYKLEKKVKQNQNAINQAIDMFNRYKFQAKYNNAVLSQKLRELEIQKEKEEEEKNRPLNPEEKKKMEEHKKFIDFLQKQVVRIERELAKREEKNKAQERKQKYLPNVHNNKGTKSSRVKDSPNKSMNISSSTSQFRDKKVTFPKV